MFVICILLTNGIKYQTITVVLFSHFINIMNILILTVLSLTRFSASSV